MKVEGSAETLGLLETLNIIYTILTRVTFLFLNMFPSPGYRTIFKITSFNVQALWKGVPNNRPPVSDRMLYKVGIKTRYHCLVTAAQSTQKCI